MRPPRPKLVARHHSGGRALKQPPTGDRQESRVRTVRLRLDLTVSLPQFRRLIRSECPCQLTQGFLVSFVRDLGEVTGEFETHPFARAYPALASLFEAVEKVADGNAKHLGYFKQAAGGDAIDAALVFVRLLIGDTNQISQLLLRQTEHNASLANARPDVAIDILGSARRSTHRYGGARRRVGLRAGGRSGSIGPVCHDDLLLLFHPALLSCRSFELNLKGEEVPPANPLSLDPRALFNRLVSTD